MASNTDIKLTIEAWAEIVIKEWLRKIEALNIHQTGALLRSFTSHVITAANGNVTMIVFAFEYYGRFVDMGVGKGDPLNEHDLKSGLGMTSRQAKPWFTSVFWKQLEILRHLLEEKNALQIERFIVRNFNDSSTEKDTI